MGAREAVSAVPCNVAVPLSTKVAMLFGLGARVSEEEAGVAAGGTGKKKGKI